ncbi:hypothetical protein KAJ87_02875 [Candidatus Pacearchaeota archaeon]|nr:hypothetical protein [Candidatus Pacearchaeota archaeon]
MAKDVFNLPANHPNKEQIDITNQTIGQISGRIRELNNGFGNLLWVIISIVIGVSITLLMSYSFFKIYGLIMFVLFVLFAIYILIKNYVKKEKEVKDNWEGREKAIGQMFVLGFLNKEQLYDYVKRKKMGQNYFDCVTNQKREEINQQVVMPFFKTKIIYKNNKEEIYEKAFVDQTNKQVLILGATGTLNKIIFVDFAEVKSVEIID